MRSLKVDKSLGVDNVPAELLKHRGSELIRLLTVCQRIWETKQWPKVCTQSLIIPIPKKGNLSLCQKHQPNKSPQQSDAEGSSQLNQKEG